MTVALQLPKALEDYDKETFQRLLDYVKELEDLTFHRNSHVEVYFQEDSGGRSTDLILHSPNGTRYAIRVDNAGVVSGTAL